MAFQSFRDLGQRNELVRERAARLASTPLARFQYVTVTFGTANTDVDISHTLAPEMPYDVRYLPVQTTAAAVLYHDPAGTRPWSSTRIWLRASVACTARVLLFLES